MTPAKPKDPIAVFGSDIGVEEIAEVVAVLESQWLGMGPQVELFEQELATHVGAEAVMVDSGSNAIFLALVALDAPPGSEVVLPSLTWVSCAHAVVLAGHQPVFCDVEIESANVTAETIAPCITTRTAAVMVVHYAGKPVDMGPVLELGVPVIEDSAHAIASSLDGRRCGAIGDVGIYSFDPMKNLATCEGGALTSPRQDLLERVRELRYSGITKSGFASASTSSPRWWEYKLNAAMPKMIPSDVAAAIARVQLRRLPAMQARRRAIRSRYDAGLRDVSWLHVPPGPGAGEEHSWFTYAVRIEGRDRDDLARHLLDDGVYTTVRYQPLHLTELYRSDAHLPVSETLSETLLNLPLHPRLSDADVDRVIDRVARW